MIRENVCQICNREFATPKGLASHLKVHSGGSQCPVCHENVKYLAPHLKNAHPDDPLVQIENGVSQLIEEVRILRKENEKLQKQKD